MIKIYSLDKLDPIAMEAVRGSTAQAGIYVTPMLIRRFKGDGNTTIIFKRLLYCSEQWADEEGWFFQTAGTIEKVTGLGNRALQRSINRLEKMGLIEKKLGGIPYKAHYRVNLSAYLELIRAESSLATSGKASLAPNGETNLASSSETSSAIRGKEVILSDPNSDLNNDTYPPIGEKPADVVEKIIKQTETHPSPEDLARKTIDAREKAGGNYAVPPSAGGADPFADGPLDAFARFIVGITPAQLPPKERKSWAAKLRQIAKQWSTEERPITAKIMERAIRAIPDSDINWKTYTTPFAGNFETDIGPLLLGGGQTKQKGKAGRDPDKFARARAMTLERLAQRGDR